jgi:diadenosine tetraphosphate (Ap4A) HIT family hydrolase
MGQQPDLLGGALAAMHGAVADAFYSADNPAYRKLLEDSAASGKCVFCDRGKLTETSPVVAEEGDWFAFRRSWPVQDRGGQDVRSYFILVKGGENGHDDQLTDDDWVAVGRLTAKLCAQFGIAGGGLCHRFGDYRFSGRTIFHHHFHLIQPRLGHVPDLAAPKDIRAIPFDFPVG